MKKETQKKADAKQQERLVEKVVEKQQPQSKSVKPMTGIQAKIQPLHDRVLIKESKGNTEKKTASGIIIPITVNEDKGGKRGEVVAIGDGRYEEGNHIPVSVQVGDEVLFQWGDKIIVEGEEYYIVKDSELLAILN